MTESNRAVVLLLTEIVREVSPEEVDFVEEQVKLLSTKKPSREEPIASGDAIMVVGAALLPILANALNEFLKTVAVKWGERVAAAPRSPETRGAELEKQLTRYLHDAKFDGAESKKIVDVVRRIARERPELIEALGK